MKISPVDILIGLGALWLIFALRKYLLLTFLAGVIVVGSFYYVERSKVPVATIPPTQTKKEVRQETNKSSRPNPERSKTIERTEDRPVDYKPDGESTDNLPPVEPEDKTEVFRTGPRKAIQQ